MWQLINDPSISEQAPARARSPTKRVVSRPPSASTASSSVAPSPAPEPEMNGASGKAAPVKAQQQQSSSKRQRPSKSSMFSLIWSFFSEKKIIIENKSSEQN